jgi:pimeloyl-ACP methyl ester carboxylesterase
MTSGTFFNTTDGTRLHVDAGGHGPVVVFQHGLCGDAGQTGEAFPATAGFRRVTVESRGHGNSQAGDPTKFSIELFANDLAEFVEQNFAQPVVLGGISMGAAISMRLAVKRPDLVRGLIIARPAWIADAAPANMLPNALVGRLLQSYPPKEALDRFRADAVGVSLANEAPDNLASLVGFFSREPLEITSALLRAISNDGPGVSPDDLRHIRVPTLVIGHGRDSIHPLSHALAVAEFINEAQFVEITPKAQSRVDYLRDIHRAIINFLEKL